MSAAGIDCGSTLIKAFWRTGTHDRFVTIDGSTPGVLELARMMKMEGVRRIRQTGIGASILLGDFSLVKPHGSPVEDEISRQADGTRWLMDRTAPAPKKMLIASVGTGVSYTKVTGTKAKRSPLGNAHGGGTIMGLAGLIGAASFRELEAAAAKGTAPDLLVKHMLPETDGTPVGNLIIAHFATSIASFEDRCDGIFSLSAASVFKDLAVLRSIPFSAKDIVVIGTVGCSLAFQAHLMKYVRHLKKGTTVHFPKHGEYAAAIGAYLDIVD